MMSPGLSHGQLTYEAAYSGNAQKLNITIRVRRFHQFNRKTAPPWSIISPMNEISFVKDAAGNIYWNVEIGDVCASLIS